MRFINNVLMCMETYTILRYRYNTIVIFFLNIKIVDYALDS